MIAAKDEAGNILWSWHIWLVEDEIKEHEYAFGAGTLMDRNLGATSAVPGEVETFGLLYQWGRKDPFLGSSSKSDGVFAKGTMAWREGNEYDGEDAVGKSIADPTFFMTNWHDSDNESDLWNNVKTIYDPCPAGWMVPDGDVWTKSGIINQLSFDYSLIGLTSEHNGSTIWFPASGYRFHYDEGGLGWVGDDTRFWSNSLESSFYNFPDMAVPEITPGEAAMGLSVRCYKIGSGTL